MKSATANRDKWLWVSLVGVLLFVAFFIILVFFGKDISISTPVYFFLVIIIGLAATGFLSGAMRSVAKYNASFDNKTLSITGPAVIFFIILYIGFKYKPEPQLVSQPLSLSVLVKDNNNTSNVITNGSVTIRLGDINYTERINDKGVASFTGLNPVYKGKGLELYCNVDNYVLPAEQQRFTLDSTASYTNLTITLQKEEAHTHIQAQVVLTKEQEGVPGVTVQFEGVDSTYTTNATGRFNATLPVKPGTELRIIVMSNTKLLYNSMRTVSDNSLLVIPIDKKKL